MAHNLNNHFDDEDGQSEINPATGLPMVGRLGVDVGGSPYGANIHQPVWVPDVSTSDDWQPSWDGF